MDGAAAAASEIALGRIAVQDPALGAAAGRAVPASGRAKARHAVRQGLDVLGDYPGEHGEDFGRRSQESAERGAIGAKQAYLGEARRPGELAVIAAGVKEDDAEPPRPPRRR